MDTSYADGNVVILRSLRIQLFEGCSPRELYLPSLWSSTSCCYHCYHCYHAVKCIGITQVHELMFTSDSFLFVCERSGSGLGALNLRRSPPFIPCHLFFSFQLVQQFHHSMLVGSFLLADTSKDKFNGLLFCFNWICRLDTCCVSNHA